MTAQTRKAKTQSAKSISPYANALDQLPTYRERIRLNVVEYLREMTGRQIVNAKRIESGDKFDAKAFWSQFNGVFRQQYGHLPLPALMRYARDKFGIESSKDILEARKSHIKRRNERMAALGGYSVADEADLLDEEEFSGLDDELELD